MLAAFENVTFGYTGVPVVKDVSFTLHEKERVGFLGGNGEGKTTILKLLTGELTPDFGTVVKKRDLTLGYLDQTGGFSADDTVYGAMEEVFAEDKRLLARLAETELAMAHADEAQLRVLAARQESLAKRIAARDSYHTGVRICTVLNGMGFAERYAQNVGTMSGGERTKLKLCRLLLEEPELLVLDEPTNHLDLPAREALEDALAAFDGTILFVSHDRRFIEAVADSIVLAEGGALTPFAGGYDAFLAARSASPPPAPAAEPQKERRSEGYRSKEERAQEAKKRSRVKEIETRLTALEAEQTALTEELAACGRDFRRAQEVTDRLAALSAEADALYEEYGALIG